MCVPRSENQHSIPSVLVIFSAPFIRVFYFLRTSADGGVRFGVLGFCYDATGICSAKKYVSQSLSDLLLSKSLWVGTRFGYEFMQDNVTILDRPLPILLLLYVVGTVVFFCIKAFTEEAHSETRTAAGLTLLGALTLVPLCIPRREPRWPYGVFGILSTLAFLSCGAAFGVTMWLFTTARNRFHALGF